MRRGLDYQVRATNVPDAKLVIRRLDVEANVE
jgi:hypothetical protein